MKILSGHSINGEIMGKLLVSTGTGIVFTETNQLIQSE